MSTLNVSNITDGTTTVGTSYVVNGSAKAYSTQQGDGTLLGGLLLLKYCFDLDLNISYCSILLA